MNMYVHILTIRKMPRYLLSHWLIWIAGLFLFTLFLVTIGVVRRADDRHALLKNDRYLSRVYAESSPFVWHGRLKYFLSERNDQQHYFQPAIYDFQSGKREAFFGSGLGLGSAAVIHDKFYATATKDWYEYGKSEIYLITSNDLRTFSDPQLIYKGSANEKIFNTDITYNSTTGTYIMAYEVQNTVNVPFTIYFLQSKDGVQWHPVNGAAFGKDVYVACPTIRYVDHYYYLLYGLVEHSDPNRPAAPTYTTRVARSTDLIHWQTSTRPLLVPDRKDEGLCTADADLAEYNGDTYILYSIGDQTTWTGLKYAVYNGSMSQQLRSFFDPIY